MTSPFTSPAVRIPLLADFSLVVSWKKVLELGQASEVIPPGTKVLVPFKDSEDLAARLPWRAGARGSRFRSLPSCPLLDARLFVRHGARIGGQPRSPSGFPRGFLVNGAAARAAFQAS